MTETDGLVFAYRLDGNGGGTEIAWEEVRAWKPGDDPVWAHLDYASLQTQEWLMGDSGLDAVVAEALLEEETRPRCVAAHGGLMLILRGVNLNPGADPEDMVSIRLWIEQGRVVSLRHRRVMAVQDLRQELVSGDGPANAGDFLVELVGKLMDRMGPVLAEIDDTVDGLEDEVLTAENYPLRAKIGALRRLAIAMRRYLAPQRDVLSRLQGEKVGWLTDLQRNRLREIGDRVIRYVEDLDSARDRAAVTQDELNSRLSEQMNKTMYVLAIVAAIFMPLGLLTGLLGINVGGIPGTENPWAFLTVCVLLLGIAILQSLLFRRMRWL